MDDPEAGELGPRLRAIEQRLRALEEGRAAVPAPPATGEIDPAADKFWVINELKAQLGGVGGVVLAGVVPLPTGEEYMWQYGRTSEDLLGSSWSELSGPIAALGHPIRLRLLQIILAGTRSTAELQADRELGTTGQLYHHLRQLLASGWLTQTARGQYAVPGNRVIPLLVMLVAAEH
jgi:hypothetical protein